MILHVASKLYYFSYKLTITSLYTLTLTPIVDCYCLAITTSDDLLHQNLFSLDIKKISIVRYVHGRVSVVHYLKRSCFFETAMMLPLLCRKGQTNKNYMYVIFVIY